MQTSRDKSAMIKSCYPHCAFESNSFQFIPWEQGRKTNRSAVGNNVSIFAPLILFTYYAPETYLNPPEHFYNGNNPSNRRKAPINQLITRQQMSTRCLHSIPVVLLLLYRTTLLTYDGRQH